MLIFSPNWFPVKMSNRNREVYIVDFMNNKLVVTMPGDEVKEMTFAQYGRFVAKNKLHWTELGLDEFDKPAIHLKSRINDWLERERPRNQSAMLYSVERDRVIVWTGKSFFMDGELICTLPSGQYVIHPASNTFHLYESEAVKSSFWRVVGALAIGGLLGMIGTSIYNNQK